MTSSDSDSVLSLPGLLWSLRSEGCFTDLRFVVDKGQGQGQEGRCSLLAHAAVVAGSNRRWGRMLQQQICSYGFNGDSDSDEIVVLLPGVSADDLAEELCYIYHHPGHSRLLGQLLPARDDGDLDDLDDSKAGRVTSPKDEADSAPPSPLPPPEPIEEYFPRKRTKRSAGAKRGKKEDDDPDDLLGTAVKLTFPEEKSKEEDCEDEECDVKKNEKKKDNATVSASAENECTECGQAFKSTSALKRHLKSSGHFSVYSCHSCPRAYKDHGALVQHVQYEHGRQERRACRVCGKRFRPKELYSHVLVHQPEKWRFKCDLCDEVCMNQRLLKTHKAKQHDSKFSCSVCSKQFTTDSNLRSHHKNVHGSECFPCEVCGKILASRSYLNLHVKRHRQEGVDFKEKECPTCGKKVRGRYYYQHVKMHDPGSWKHLCKYCGLRFQGKYKLIEHVAVTHTGEERFQCEKCGRKFQTTARRSVHKKTCSGVGLERQDSGRDLEEVGVAQLMELELQPSADGQQQHVLLKVAAV